ncbi:MAG: hypothetical protein LUH01_02235, partial [Parabacteroides gordonii]|nr:hypothetical protein [Parabacteroides gordonii]
SKLASIDLTPLSSWTSVTSAYSLLYGCRALTSIDLTPLASWTGVRNASYLLGDCSCLTSIDLSTLAKWSNTMINNTNIISSCNKLTFIIINSSIPFPLTSGALTNGNSCPIYVPDDAVDTYKTATNWSAYADRIKPISEKDAE